MTAYSVAGVPFPISFCEGSLLAIVFKGKPSTRAGWRLPVPLSKGQPKHMRIPLLLVLKGFRTGVGALVTWSKGSTTSCVCVCSCLCFFRGNALPLFDLSCPGGWGGGGGGGGGQHPRAHFQTFFDKKVEIDWTSPPSPSPPASPASSATHPASPATSHALPLQHFFNKKVELTGPPHSPQHRQHHQQHPQHRPQHPTHCRSPNPPPPYWSAAFWGDHKPPPLLVHGLLGKPKSGVFVCSYLCGYLFHSVCEGDPKHVTCFCGFSFSSSGVKGYKSMCFTCLFFKGNQSICDLLRSHVFLLA